MKKTNYVNYKLSDLIGDSYDDYFKTRKRYRVCKGSRASKKSKNTAIYYIAMFERCYKLGLFPNLLVVRRVFRTLKDSCFAELKWAMKQLHVENKWIIKESPLELTYKLTGQKIYFRGLDDPLKITSITVDIGYMCWLWVEEAYEISNESDFDMLDECIRGRVQDGLFKQTTLTFNPWNEHHWLKKRFFDNPPLDSYVTSTTYKCNEFLDDTDKAKFEDMKIRNPRRYRVAGLGEWGISEGLIFEDYEEKIFDIAEVSKLSSVVSAFGLDFGYTNDPTAFFCGLIDTKANIIYVFDEIYKKAMQNKDIADEIIKKGYAKEIIVADSAEPKSIDNLYNYGLTRIRKSKKGKDSIMNGIDFIQGYHIVVHPKCKNFLTEISNYQYAVDNKTGKRLNKPIDEYNHLMDAMRYALEGLSNGNFFSFD